MPRKTVADIDLQKPEGSTAIAWPSVNCCAEGADFVVSWSDGEKGTPPKKMMVLRLSWDDVVKLVEERGTEIQANLKPMTEAVSGFLETDQ